MENAPAGSDIETVIMRLRAAGCVFAEDEARLLLDAADSARSLAAMVDRRVGGEPLEQVVGYAEFCGLRISVEPGVFLPRRRTEHLARLAAAHARPGAIVLDLCCGTGAIGAAVVHLASGGGHGGVPIELHAADVDAVAVRCARRNLGAGGHIHHGDLFAPLPERLRGRVNVLAVNVPYVPSDEIRLLPAEARDYEPRATLDGGGDGLNVLRRVLADATNWLAPGGVLFTEASERQAGTALMLVRAAGLEARVDCDEEIGATVVIGIAPVD